MMAQTAIFRACESVKVSLVNAPLTLWNGEKQNGKDTVYIFAIPDIGPNLLTIGEISKVNSGPQCGSLATWPPTKIDSNSSTKPITDTSSTLPGRR